jgi:hypothetical protein
MELDIVVLNNSNVIMLLKTKDDNVVGENEKPKLAKPKKNKKLLSEPTIVVENNV